MFTAWVVPYAVLAIMAVATSARSATLAAGTTLEVRLGSAVGSHISNPGDPIHARLIAPIAMGEKSVLLEGASLSGVVADRTRIGLGVKHGSAGLRLNFQSLHLADGTEVAADARVLEVETARERVDEQGRIVGIHPAANLSSGISFLVSTTLLHSGLAGGAILFKFLAVRSPDPEIFLPAGAELIVRLTKDVELAARELAKSATEPVSPSDLTQVNAALLRIPSQQAEMAGHRSVDPVNVALVGTQQQVESAFKAAGWSEDGPHSVRSLYRLYHSMVQRMGYTNAPMSRLTLNGVLPTLSYQKSFNTITRRHHVRLWRQENSDVWFGAATEDIGLTVHAMHLTHAVDKNIDNERAKIANDLWFTGCVAGASELQRDSFEPVRSGGAAILTDGSLAVLELRSCEHPTADIDASRPGASRWAMASQATVRDLMRANPVTLSLVIGRMVSHGVASRTHTSAPAEPIRRPSVADSRSTARETQEALAARVEELAVTAEAPVSGYGDSLHRARRHNSSVVPEH